MDGNITFMEQTRVLQNSVNSQIPQKDLQGFTVRDILPTRTDPQTPADEINMRYNVGVAESFSQYTAGGFGDSAIA